MTNILATLSFILVTNWTTVSVTTPVSTSPLAAVLHLSTAHQEGTVAVNTLATIVYNGHTNYTTLESNIVSSIKKLERDIPQVPTNQYYIADIQDIIGRYGNNTLTCQRNEQGIVTNQYLSNESSAFKSMTVTNLVTDDDFQAVPPVIPNNTNRLVNISTNLP